MLILDDIVSNKKENKDHILPFRMLIIGPSGSGKTNTLYMPHNTKKINIAYKSKHDLTREKQVILLMISNGEKWHYLTAKKLIWIT